MRPRVLGPSAVALSLSLLVAACSGGGGSSAPGPATTAVATAAAVSSPATGGSSTGTTGSAWSTGQSLCVLLGPGDFAGVAGVVGPQDNNDGPDSHYCSYTPDKSGAQGGVEFDAFVGTDAAGTYQTVLGEGPAGVDAAVPGADASSIALAPSEGSPWIVVRKGNLVFAISIPKGPGTEALLRSLAALVLQRGAAAVTATTTGG